MARLVLPVQGLRSHPLHGIHRMNVAAASQAGDGFTVGPANQRWVRHDDKNKIYHRWAGYATAPLS